MLSLVKLIGGTFAGWNGDEDRIEARQTLPVSYFIIGPAISTIVDANNLPMYIVALLLGLIIVLAGVWRGWLTRTGALAALTVGGTTLTFGGLPLAVPLVTFFLTSTLLSKADSAAKDLASQRFEKGHARDALQVLANGGVVALAAFGSWLSSDPRWFVLGLGAVAAVTADTWATELGTLSQTPPRSVITGRSVGPGASGGVTLLGTAASIAGGLLIGGVGALFVEEPPRALIAGAVAGSFGSLLDSLLGATCQRHYWDPVHRELTEKSERDGRPLSLRRGVPWVNNDVVNLFAALGGGICAVLLWMVVG